MKITKDNTIIKKARSEAVAGLFYPSKKRQLQNSVSDFLKKAEGKPTSSNKKKNLRALLVPHAGYDYSGLIAAYAFAMVKDLEIDTVFLLGSAHHAYIDGAAIDDSSSWQTPLGDIPINRDKADRLIKSNSDIAYDQAAHKEDHVLEVQMPFLQTTLQSGFNIVPILVGQANPKTESIGLINKLANSIQENFSDNDLLVVSSDLSHYPKSEDAEKIDQKTLKIINSLNIIELEKHVDKVMSLGIANEETCACGLDAIKVLMAIAKNRKWQPDILKYANSGNVPKGQKERTVGYGAMAFSDSVKTKQNPILVGKEKESDSLNPSQKKTLLNLVRDTVEVYVKTGKIVNRKISDQRLNKQEGAFVTIHKNGRLRGCIGQIIPAEEPLWKVVQALAIEAATEDYRFGSVSEAELDSLDYEISVLTVPEQIFDWKTIKLGKHGVIIKKGRQSGVFLPQVALETGWGLEEFLGTLCSEKAGLPFEAYKNDKEAEIYVFSAIVFGGK